MNKETTDNVVSFAATSDFSFATDKIFSFATGMTKLDEIDETKFIEGKVTRTTRGNFDEYHIIDQRYTKWILITLIFNF